MAPNLKIKKACDAMKVFGIQETKTKSFLKELLKTYENSWDFIEDEGYKVLFEAIFEESDAQATEKKKKEEKKVSTDASTSRGKKKPPEQTPPLLKDEEDDMDEDEVPLKRRLRSKRARGCDSNTSLGVGSPKSKSSNKEDSKIIFCPPVFQPVEEGEEDNMTVLPPLKRYVRRRGDRVSAMTVSKNSTNQTFETETMCDMNQAGSESGADGTSMALVVVPECDISADGWRAYSIIKDITVGEENVEIPWVNEINDMVPSHFRYLHQSCAFQDAAVKLSLSSFSDEQCCSSSCIEDCLASEMLCNCTISVDIGFAYTVGGVLKEDFLEARISEARDQRKQVLQFCKDCPLERAKKKEILEPCKGHLKRKAIKECWIKCGCTKRCGNRAIQRGIHNKLQVFFTPNGRGWGLRTLEKLPKGAFVCEYIGEILTIPELYQCSFEDKVTCPVILDAHWGFEESLEDDKALCLDGTHYGNILRFLNHRCLDANLIEVPVHVETPHQHYYHLAFFTTRDIEAMEELTWDYGIDFDDEDSLIKTFDCLCGSRFCRNSKRSKKTKKLMIEA